MLQSTLIRMKMYKPKVPIYFDILYRMGTYYELGTKKGEIRCLNIE